ncbi:MAG: hypothetical protein SGI96_13615 [Bacteroidota bacterium]|nr:hypothetical protein [Bacteroidota bacterium]
MKTKLCFIPSLAGFTSLLFILFACVGMGQNQRKVFYLDKGNYIDFTKPVPSVTSDFTIPPAGHVVNGIYGIDRNLLFYVRDNEVYNRNGGLIGFFFATSEGMGPEIVIVPVPGICGKYYLIYTSITFGAHGKISNHALDPWYLHLHYLTIDLLANNGAGSISATAEQGHIGSEFDTEFYGGMAVSNLQNNNTRFLYTAAGSFSSGAVTKYIISSSGISTPGTILYQASTA